MFAHLPMIHGTDGKKLSKRHGAMAVGDYRHEGILPSAMVNFLALLGWSPGGDREVMTTRELIEHFSEDSLLKKASVFDLKKLEWMNGQHLQHAAARRGRAPHHAGDGRRWTRFRRLARREQAVVRHVARAVASPRAHRRRRRATGRTVFRRFRLARPGRRREAVEGPGDRRSPRRRPRGDSPAWPIGRPLRSRTHCARSPSVAALAPESSFSRCAWRSRALR